MKKTLYLAFVAVFCLLALSSCKSNRMLLQMEVKAANSMCPQKVAEGLTMTKIELTGDYVTYTYEGDDSLYWFDQSLVNDDLKQSTINSLVESSLTDKNVKKYLKLIKDNNVGMICHYFTSNSSMDLVIEPWEFN